MEPTQLESEVEFQLSIQGESRNEIVSAGGRAVMELFANCTLVTNSSQGNIELNLAIKIALT